MEAASYAQLNMQEFSSTMLPPEVPKPSILATQENTCSALLQATSFCNLKRLYYLGHRLHHAGCLVPTFPPLIMLLIFLFMQCCWWGKVYPKCVHPSVCSDGSWGLTPIPLCHTRVGFVSYQQEEETVISLQDIHCKSLPNSQFASIKRKD